MLNLVRQCLTSRKSPPPSSTFHLHLHHCTLLFKRRCEGVCVAVTNQPFRKGFLGFFCLQDYKIPREVVVIMPPPIWVMLRVPVFYILPNLCPPPVSEMASLDLGSQVWTVHSLAFETQPLLLTVYIIPVCSAKQHSASRCLRTAQPLVVRHSQQQSRWTLLFFSLPFNFACGCLARSWKIHRNICRLFSLKSGPSSEGIGVSSSGWTSYCWNKHRICPVSFSLKRSATTERLQPRHFTLRKNLSDNGSWTPNKKCVID